MASVGNDPNGRKRILFYDGKKRKTIRIGKASKKQAAIVCTHIERLLSAKVTGQPVGMETAHWLASLDDTLTGRLVKAELIEPVERTGAVALDKFIAEYIDGRTDVKPLTIAKYRTTEKLLNEFFDPSPGVSDVTEGDADDWRRWLKSSPDGTTREENTVRKHIAVAKVFFTGAVRKRLIDRNPFEGQAATIRANESRFYFVTRDDTKKVIDACPDAQWRLIVTLSRYGGLRCPSEHLPLTWDLIDWDQDRMTVMSPKTEHHDGGESRVVPIFPELRPYLDAVWDEDNDGDHIITRHRDRNSNLRTQFTRIIQRAGLEPWPKLFQNLRSTRQTELEESFPSHVVCKWIGNSEAVARKHYLQVTDEHFEKAANPQENPQQSPAASTFHDVSQETTESEKPAENNGFCKASSEKRSLSNSGGGIRTPDTRIMIPLL